MVRFLTGRLIFSRCEIEKKLKQQNKLERNEMSEERVENQQHTRTVTIVPSQNSNLTRKHFDSKKTINNNPIAIKEMKRRTDGKKKKGK